MNVRCDGQIPDSGLVQLSTLSGQAANRIPLVRVSSDSKRFVGDLTHLVESFRATVTLGDAISRPILIEVVPLPLIEIDWKIVSLEYAAAAAGSMESDQGSHQRIVLEGSTAQLQLACSNKRLKSARLKYVDQTEFELVPSSRMIGNRC